MTPRPVAGRRRTGPRSCRRSPTRPRRRRVQGMPPPRDAVETRGGEGADGNTRAPAVASGGETFQHERCTEVASSDGPGSSPIDGSWRRRAAKWGSRRRDGLRLPQEAALASNGSGKARARSFHRSTSSARPHKRAARALADSECRSTSSRNAAASPVRARRTRSPSPMSTSVSVSQASSGYPRAPAV